PGQVRRALQPRRYSEHVGFGTVGGCERNAFPSGTDQRAKGVRSWNCKLCPASRATGSQNIRVSAGYASQLGVGHYLAERRDSRFDPGSATHRRDLRAHPGGAAQNLRQRRLPGRNPLVLRKTETGLSGKMITCRLSQLAEKPYMNKPRTIGFRSPRRASPPTVW